MCGARRRSVGCGGCSRAGRGLLLSAAHLTLRAVEQQPHHSALISAVRRHVGGEWHDVEAHVLALLGSPGWAVVSAIVEDQRAAELAVLTGPKLLQHGQYIAASRGVRALEMCQQVGDVVLHECARLRAEAERKAADSAAGGRGEE
jgi:hypothetical protein